MAIKTRSTAPVAKATKSVKLGTNVDKRASSAAGTRKSEVRIFVSCSHHDAAAQEKLNRHLAPWRRDGVTVWYDENIELGAAEYGDQPRTPSRAHIRGIVQPFVP